MRHEKSTNLLTHMAVAQAPASLVKVRLKGMMPSDTNSPVVAQTFLEKIDDMGQELGLGVLVGS